MAKNSTYKTPFRRKREGKTNYRKRLKLFLSEKPRVVVRRSNKCIRMQLITYNKKGDETLVSAISSELAKYGYKGSKCNIPAAYLTGLLFGKRAKKADFEEGILDIGLYSTTHGCRVYAALKGAVDGGMKIPHSEEVFGNEERIKGKHIAEFKKDTSIVENSEAVREKIEREG